MVNSPARLPNGGRHRQSRRHAADLLNVNGVLSGSVAFEWSRPADVRARRGSRSPGPPERTGTPSQPDETSTGVASPARAANECSRLSAEEISKAARIAP